MTNQRIHTPVTLVLAALLLVVGVDVATYAGTGDSLILGRANKAGTTTIVKNTGSGAALSLTTRSSAPPLVVSSSTKVRRLNADRVDGRDSTTLEPSVTVYRISPADDRLVNGARYTMNIAPGRYMVTWRLNGVNSGVTNYCWTAPASELTDRDYSNMVTDSTTGSYQGASAAGELRVPAANDFVFECEGSDITLLAPIVVTARALSVTGNGTTGPAARLRSPRTTS